MEIKGVYINIDTWCLISQYLNIKKDRTQFGSVCRTWRIAIAKARKPNLIFNIGPESIEWEGKLTHGAKYKISRVRGKMFRLIYHGTDFKNITMHNSRGPLAINGKRETFPCECSSDDETKIRIILTRFGSYFRVTREFLTEIQSAIAWCDNFSE